ncbi:recombinase family protein [Arthrobacter sp. B10-11]|uniref:recombinase family protein n=1 Tax=Arthrobacter sp. B10-11 TaxID=3081160 RepID=UPI0029544643|nr:recombinase family protein [Arthrobacter sp. B10-11]MDV8146265.1 recombinase family protein [Arthrobacter sp. B10-11]
MKAIVYVRISSDRKGEEAGVTRQREDCVKRAAERGWEVVEVLTDNDISASGKRLRPGFEAMLKALANDEAQVVIAWDLTRLQRNRRDEVRLYELCQRKNAQLSLVNGTELDFSTAAGRFVADSLGNVARLEIEMKSDRQKRQQLQAAQQGKRVGGRRPFGYDKDGKTLRIDEADALKAAYESILYGASLREIARTWNAQGYATGQTRYKEGHKGEPSPWRADSVRHVLLNPRNAGKRAYRDEIMGDAEWPAIVDEERWLAVKAVLENPTRQSGRPTGKRLLSGLAVCGICGATVHAGGATRRGVGNYRCSGSTGHFSRKADPVDEYVSEAVIGILSRPDAYQLLHDDTKADAKALQAEAAGLRARLDGLAVEWADGILTNDQLRAATTRLRQKLDDVNKQLTDAGRVNVLGPMVQSDDTRKAWDSLSVSQRQAVIGTLMTVVVHGPGRGVRVFDPATVELIPR